MLIGFNNRFDKVFSDMQELHNRIHDSYFEDLTFKILTDPGEYIASESKFEDEDTWRVGPSFCEEEFIIEDNTGRNIPILWSDLPSLLRALESLSERRSEDISRGLEAEEKARQERIQELREQLKELEGKA